MKEQIESKQTFWNRNSGEIIDDSDKSYTKIIEWAREDVAELATTISQQSAEIEKVRQSLVDSNYIIDRLVSDYPSELWTRSEVDGWRNQGLDQIKDNKAALEVLNDPNPKSE